MDKSMYSGQMEEFFRGSRTLLLLSFNRKFLQLSETVPTFFVYFSQIPDHR